MHRFKQLNITLATAGMLVSGVAQAALNDRGGGLLYDDVLDVTWLQDANYAKTSGYDADGRMKLTAAKTWANDLVYGGYDDWRLAANTPVGTDWNYSHSPAGTTDDGYNITSPHSELSYMYYVNLGLTGHYSQAGDNQPNFGVFGNGTGFGQSDVGPVKNLQAYVYWSGTTYAPNPTGYGWVFQTFDGWQTSFQNYNSFYAWAVRDGDVAAIAAPVPEPETYAMMLAGLGLIGFVARRRKRVSVG